MNGCRLSTNCSLLLGFAELRNASTIAQLLSPKGSPQAPRWARMSGKRLGNTEVKQ